MSIQTFVVKQLKPINQEKKKKLQFCIRGEIYSYLCLKQKIFITSQLSKYERIKMSNYNPNILRPCQEFLLHTQTFSEEYARILLRQLKPVIIVENIPDVPWMSDTLFDNVNHFKRIRKESQTEYALNDDLYFSLKFQSINEELLTWLQETGIPIKKITFDCGKNIIISKIAIQRSLQQLMENCIELEMIDSDFVKLLTSGSSGLEFLNCISITLKDLPPISVALYSRLLSQCKVVKIYDTIVQDAEEIKLSPDITSLSILDKDTCDQEKIRDQILHVLYETDLTPLYKLMMSNRANLTNIKLLECYHIDIICVARNIDFLHSLEQLNVWNVNVLRSVKIGHVDKYPVMVHSLRTILLKKVLQVRLYYDGEVFFSDWDGVREYIGFYQKQKGFIQTMIKSHRFNIASYKQIKKGKPTTFKLRVDINTQSDITYSTEEMKKNGIDIRSYAVQSYGKFVETKSSQIFLIVYDRYGDN
eukprot:403364363